MPRERPEILTRAPKGRDAKITYATEFRDMLRENPGIIKIAIRLADEAVEKYEPKNIQIGSYRLKYNRESRGWFIDSDSGQTSILNRPEFGRGVFLVPGKPSTDIESGLKVTVLGRSLREGIGGDRSRFDKADYFKFYFKGKAFFVKRSFITITPGFEEFQSIVRAKKALSDLDNVRLVEAQMGYQDNNESWYISKWENLESAGFLPENSLFGGPDNYGKHRKRGTFLQDSKNITEEFNDYSATEQTILSRLYKAGIVKDADNNLFYNLKTKQFIFLDLGFNESKGLGNPIRKPRE